MPRKLGGTGYIITHTPTFLSYYIHLLFILALVKKKMEFSLNQSTELFDDPKNRPARAPFGIGESELNQNQDMQYSDSKSLY